jgi:hypothetical protein
LEDVGQSVVGHDVLGFEVGYPFGPRRGDGLELFYSKSVGFVAIAVGFVGGGDLPATVSVMPNCTRWNKSLSVLGAISEYSTGIRE